MANFGFTASRTPSAALSAANLNAPAASMKRIKLYDLTLGSEGTPADVANLWSVQRTTTAGTATAITPNPLDPADAACVATASGLTTVQPTITANSTLLAIGLNQKASFRWVAAPGSELVVPAIASNGLTLTTPAVGSTVSCTATILFQEQ
jgi:hypothetical protein